ncbi:restriction endonuclease subunit S [Acinetobacter radioresistens]|uniref:restriction endonuclease subunit S n=1 Tax=Acinetobacter radioresistens TaxID=40216 RepID=UPI00200647AE|nr:restriction endonuclease subunit S [Acinetobacter radioresistens]MCK4106604.1 hypothetical protein [Acinetobacter radioresistens]
MNTSPEHWVKVSLKDICKFINGRAFKQSEWCDEGLPIIRIQNLNNPSSKYNYFNGIVDKRHCIENGDLLFAWSGTPGTSFGAHIWERGSAVLNQHIFKVIFNKDFVEPVFLKFAINNTLNELILQARGAVGLRHITKGTLENTIIALPSLKEQQQIIEILTSYLSQISSIKNNLQQILKLGEYYKKSILKDAFSSNRNVHSNNKIIILKDFVDEGPSNGWSPKTGPNATGALSLKLTATTSGYLRLDEGAVKRIYEQPDANSRYWLKSGDLLVQRANTLEYLGASAIFEGPELTYIYPDLMMRLRIFDVSKRLYLWRYLNSSYARSYLQNRATGTSGSMPKINSTTLKNLPIPCPSNGDFKRIVENLDREFSNIAELLQYVEKSNAHLEQLEKLIFKQAFAGKLVKMHGNHCATDLLQQIKSSLFNIEISTKDRGLLITQNRKKENILYNKVRADVSPDHLNIILINLGGTAIPLELWRKSEMIVEEFYKQLRQEIENNFIICSNDGKLVSCNAP